MTALQASRPTAHGELGRIPKTLWMLWLQGWDDAPDVVRRCADVWRRRNPGWNIVQLRQENLGDFLDPSELDAMVGRSPNHQSDLIRLAILRRHGGVWTDAAVLCRRELDAWLPAYVGSGFFGFRDPGPDRRCASWFLASEPGGPIVTQLDARLRDFFTGVDPRPTGRLRRSLVHRLRPIVESRAAWTRFWFTPISMRSLRVTPYYSLHYLFNHLVARDPACRAQWDATPGFPADDPHLVARLGMTAPATEDVRRQLDTSPSPLFKLSWKHPITVDGQATTIGHALSSQEVRRG